MNLLINIFQRLFGSPKTSAGGVVAGTGIAVAVSAILDQAGCQFSNVQWWEIMGMVFGGPAAVGALSTDNGKTVTPISPLTGPGIGAILLCIMATGLVACASYVDMGNGKTMRTVVTEMRSPFGTNAGFMQLQECDKVVQPQQTTMYEYVNCTPQSHWVPINSQGQGGQIVGGALTGLGFGLGSAFSGAGGTSSSSSSAASSSSSAIGGKGH